jgi:hypothetical protein
VCGTLRSALDRNLSTLSTGKRIRPVRPALSTIVLLALCTVASCVTGAGATFDGPILRAATDTPEAFTFATPPMVPAACTSPAVDPRDGTAITFVRAAGGIGDFQVPEGHYGVRSGELLRIRCGSGEPIGVVQR